MPLSRYRPGFMSRADVRAFQPPGATPSGRLLSSANKPLLRLFDPRLTAGLSDPKLVRLRCLASRPQRHHRSAVLTARAAGRVFCGGDGDGTADGRINAWSTSNGTLLGATNLESKIMCLTVVETVRPANPLRGGPAPKGKGSAEGFGCDLIVWAGMADGRIAVLGGGDLGLRTTLGGHRGAIACLCSPGAPPSTPAVGASIVLSGGEDGAMRLWDARTAECLRSIPGGGTALRAMLPVWAPDGAGDSQRERCRVWSVDADQTLCVWEPKRPPAGAKDGGAAARAPPPPQTIELNADVSELAASVDGTLVCATAGRDGVLVLDGNARLRARLACAAAAMDTISCVHIVGRGRQLWTGSGELGGVALWERESSPATASAELSWTYACTRRLPCAPLLALRPAAASQVWGACADGTVCVWMAEAAAAEAAEAITKASFFGSGSGGGGGAHSAHLGSQAQQQAIALPLLRLLRAAMGELRRSRDEFSQLLGSLSEGWAILETSQIQIGKKSDQNAKALHDETIARLEAEARARALVTEVDALQYELSHLGQSRDSALALKAAREAEVTKLKAAEASLKQRLKKEEEVGQALAEQRVVTSQAKADRERAQAELRSLKHALLDAKKEGRSELEALKAERDALEAGLEQRSIETSTLTEALRQREQSEAAARAEAARATAALAAHQEEAARMRHEREQMRQANARMQSLLERLRLKMSQQALAGGAAGASALSGELAADATAALNEYAGAVGAPPTQIWVEGGSTGFAPPPPPPSAPPASPALQPPVLFDLQPRRTTAPPVESAAVWAPPTTQPDTAAAHQAASAQLTKRASEGGARVPPARPTPLGSGRSATGAAAPPNRPNRAAPVRPPPATRAPMVGGYTPATIVGGGAVCASRGRGASPSVHFGTPASQGASGRRDAGGTAPPTTPRTQPASDASAWPVGEASVRPTAPERRSATLVLQLASLRTWVQRCLGYELPPGDLPTLLEDGEALLALADRAVPGVAAPLAGASAADKLAAFTNACLRIGVPEDEVLAPSAWQPGQQRSAAAIAAALTALAREAAARSMLPAL
jgi:WD40 repeat protein